MEEKKEVVLHGMWASPFARWVKIALEIKSIAYEYVEENLKNKSELLAKYNPIYKKVPVLVHNGNPIVESLIILQYIDDTWKYPPYLLPSDAYSRSLVRFWGDFLLNQLDITLRKAVASEGVEEEKNIKEVKKHLNTLEENMNIIFPYDSPSCVEDMRMMDIMLCTLRSVVTSIEDAFDLNIMEPQKYPLTSSRMASLSSLKLVKDTAPPHDKFVKFFRAYRRLYI